MNGAPVMSISTAKNNAELIAQCAELGYLQRDWRTLDPTYGLGRFWAAWKPDALVRTDLDPTRSHTGPNGWLTPIDFRDMPWADDEFDAVVFDPPYKLNGTGGSHPSDEAYGVARAGVRWQDKIQLCLDGITECVRVLRPDGVLLVKCQDQVCSGQVRWQTIDFTNHAVALGCRLVDALHLPSYRPQPEGRRQVHARRNYSTLLVFRKAPLMSTSFDMAQHAYDTAQPEDCAPALEAFADTDEYRTALVEWAIDDVPTRERFEASAAHDDAFDAYMEGRT